jgi:hypothetical protein
VTPAQRALRARIAAHSMHAQGKTNVKPAQDAFLARFERQVDPDGVLSPEERQRRSEAARRAHFAALALKSSQARARRKAVRARTGRAE